MKTKTIFVTFAVSVLSGCISIGLGGTKPEVDYIFPAPSGDWLPIGDASAGQAFRSRLSGSVLGLSSSCDDAADLSFNDLVKAVTTAIPGQTASDPLTPVTAAPIPGRMTRVKGKVDDSPIEMLAIVLRSPHCVYDVTLTGRAMTTQDAAEALRLARGIQPRSVL